MKTITSFPYPVREVEHFFIPMPDGVRLGAKMWLPEDAERHPVPAVLEYIPYRKRDWTAIRDHRTHPYLAGHGYACIRVDIRGSGDSEGVLTDEYLPQELNDGVEVLRWIARQAWCTGAVGMMGISWGGFNSLQIAALQPPELKAIITLCSTDDRYADDVHYMGGCLLGDNLSWGSTMFAYNASPPDPALVGGRWRQMWLDRLRGSGLWLQQWLAHQRRDAYWKHGSVCEDYQAIQCPVMAVSGWADAYSNAVFRLLANLRVPRLGLVGPWGHQYPHLGRPGPATGFLQEAIRWWDKWLKGEESGIMQEPMLRAWMQESMPPSTAYDDRLGRWVAEPSWPSPNIHESSFPLRADGRIGFEEGIPQEGSFAIQSPLSVGLFGGKWCSVAASPDLPDDQREEDGGALVFDSPPLSERLEILGSPVAELEVSADRPVAMVAARLSDIATDGKATRVTYGLQNLTHRDGHEEVALLEPGRSYRARLVLNEVAQVFPRGHRIRLAISTSYWPVAWPPPEPVTLTIHTAASRLMLPIRPPRCSDDEAIALPRPEGASPARFHWITRPESHWHVLRDLGANVSCLEVLKDRGTLRFDPIHWEVQSRAVERYSIQHNDFLSPRGEVEWDRQFRREEWLVRTKTRTILTATKTHFRLRADLDAYEGDTRVHCQSWEEWIRRDGV